MKRFVRFVSLLCILSVLLSIPAFAAEKEQASPYSSSYFDALQTYIYRIDGNRIGIWFYALAKRYMDKLGVDYIRLESSADLSKWTTIKTFDPADYTQMQTTNAFTYENGVPHTATYNRYYRAYVRFYAKEGSSTGTYTLYTDPFYV